MCDQFISGSVCGALATTTQSHEARLECSLHSSREALFHSRLHRLRLADTTPKNPTEQLETLRRSSLAEVEHLNMPDPNKRRLSNRDMPEHSADLPIHGSSPPTNTQTTEPSYFVDPHGLPTVPEEEGSTGYGNDGSAGFRNDGGMDNLSPSSQPSALQSTTTKEAELLENATASGQPMFSEPEFGIDGIPEVPLDTTQLNFNP